MPPPLTPIASWLGLVEGTNPFLSLTFATLRLGLKDSPMLQIYTPLLILSFFLLRVVSLPMAYVVLVGDEAKYGLRGVSGDERGFSCTRGGREVRQGCAVSKCPSTNRISSPPNQSNSTPPQHSLPSIRWTCLAPTASTTTLAARPLFFSGPRRRAQ